jgi:hypothetical protein
MAVAVALVVPFCALAGCKRERPQAIAEQAPPKASASAPLAAGESSYLVRPAGLASVAIDAPLENFRGESKSLGGFFRLRPDALDRTSGIVTIGLEAFTTHTFADKDKDDTQTEHVHNWFEIGDDVKRERPVDFEHYKDVVFRIDGVESVAPSSDLAQVPEKDGARVVTLVARGTLWVHGRPAEKRAPLKITFRGPAAAPTEIAFESTADVVVSLAAHDVKPRDTAGKFLDGALSAVGKKLDDAAKVRISGGAGRASAQGPDADAIVRTASSASAKMAGAKASASSAPGIGRAGS